MLNKGIMGSGNKKNRKKKIILTSTHYLFFEPVFYWDIYWGQLKWRHKGKKKEVQQNKKDFFATTSHPVSVVGMKTGRKKEEKDVFVCYNVLLIEYTAESFCFRENEKKRMKTVSEMT